ncbi:MAG: hypothetical protein PHT29_05325 [Eubacteriales bacterium]|nr:hypothetical protein [Eubacteriales bacterium]MDD3290288.1 hypothetical protein [Eubacteriales bacterium]MDD3863689.1 hypothetical protein [Eubacteriales bacterium]MDD4445262.1 hypothetical protein [Eubacteriales bacterium]
MQKVRYINLERGFPTVDLAVRDMVGQLGTYKRMGYRALVFIHGWGSSGTGGGIRNGVRKKLRERSLSGLVQDFCSGDEWVERRAEFIDYCSQLKQFDRDIAENKGVTVVLLK